jgi:hypothetical protein
MKKKLLLALFGILTALAVFAMCASMQVRATPDERSRPLAGDNLIPQPIGSFNHTITIRRPPRAVWPWLAQMGSDRAGWYAYDIIDNGGRHSVERILPEYQNIGVTRARASARSIGGSATPTTFSLLPHQVMPASVHEISTVGNDEFRGLSKYLKAVSVTKGVCFRTWLANFAPFAAPRLTP